MDDEQSQLQPSATRQLRFLHRVMGLFAMADVHGDLWWNTKGELFATCNDTFWWATSDCEQITPERLPILERAYVDLAAIDPLATIYLTELYAARVRGMRPQGAAYPKPGQVHCGHVEAVIALFDACGPERTPDFDNPLPSPRTVPKDAEGDEAEIRRIAARPPDFVTAPPPAMPLDLAARCDCGYGVHARYSCPSRTS